MLEWKQNCKWFYLFFVVVAVTLFFCDGRELNGEPGSKEWTEPLTGMEFVWIPGGCFMMGCVSESRECEPDERPVHKVCVDGFWIGKYEVTNQQYRVWKPEHESKGYFGDSLNDENQPVINVGQKDAKRFTAWLMEQHHGTYTFRLPIEAEWEYAARAGTTSSRFWGENPDDTCRYANVYDQALHREKQFPGQHYACDDGYVATAPVGSFRPNAFGLYDMLGNVVELCLDWYDETYYAKSPLNNPQGPLSGYFLVGRGGSWGDYSDDPSVRSASRHAFIPDARNEFIGFRIVGVEGIWQRQPGTKDLFAPDRPHRSLQKPEHMCCSPQVRTVYILQELGKRITSVAFSPDGRLLASGNRGPLFASGSRDSEITLWDVNTGKRLKTLEGHSNDVNSVAFSPDGSILASGSRDKTLILWDVKSGTQLNRFHGVQDTFDYMNAVAFSPDGTTLFAGSSNGYVYAWNRESGMPIHTFVNKDGRTHSIAVSPDGKTLIAGNSPILEYKVDQYFYRFWEVQSGKMLFEVSLKYWGDKGIALSPDGRIVAFAGEDEIEIWETETYCLLHCLEKPSHDPVRTLAFSPNGRILASGSNDHNVYLWDTTSWGKVRSVARHGSNISALAFSPDSKMLASADVDGNLALWQIVPENTVPTWK
jgi:sulfatase modifying factor 1